MEPGLWLSNALNATLPLVPSLPGPGLSPLTYVMLDQLLDGLELGPRGDVITPVIQLPDLIVLHVVALRLVPVPDGQGVGTWGGTAKGSGWRQTQAGCLEGVVGAASGHQQGALCGYMGVQRGAIPQARGLEAHPPLLSRPLLELSGCRQGGRCGETSRPPLPLPEYPTHTPGMLRGVAATFAGLALADEEGPSGVAVTQQLPLGVLSPHFPKVPPGEEGKEREG